MPSSLSVTVSSFRFKVRDMHLFLSLEHLEAPAAERVMRPINVCVVVAKRGGGGMKKRGIDGQKARGWSSQNAHSFLLSLPSYVGAVYGTPPKK